MAQWQRIRLPVQEMQETQVPSLGLKGPVEKEWQPTPVFLPGKCHGRGVWWATVHGVAELDTTE